MSLFGHATVERSEPLVKGRHYDEAKRFLEIMEVLARVICFPDRTRGLIVRPGAEIRAILDQVASEPAYADVMSSVRQDPSGVKQFVVFQRRTLVGFGGRTIVGIPVDVDNTGLLQYYLNIAEREVRPRLGKLGHTNILDPILDRLVGECVRLEGERQI